MNDTEYTELLDELGRDADQAAWFVGFLASVVDSTDFSEKLDGSVTGHAVVAARAAVKTAVVLYVARAWDTSGDAVSIRRARHHLPSLERLDARRDASLGRAGIGNSDGRSLETKLKAFEAMYVEAEARPYHPTLRLLRTEHFAHRVLERDSRDRTKLAKAGLEVPSATYRDLLELATETLNLVGQVQYLWRQVVNPYPDMVARYTDRCHELWRVLPVLREVERPDLR
jgi:hypothetical protein